MAEELLSTAEAARRLGIQPATLYGWLAQSDTGTFVLRGRQVTVAYFQGGAKGQGRILLDAEEVRRLRDLMRATPCPPTPRRTPVPRTSYPDISVPLGRPDQ